MLLGPDKEPLFVVQPHHSVVLQGRFELDSMLLDAQQVQQWYHTINQLLMRLPLFSSCLAR